MGKSIVMDLIFEEIERSVIGAKARGDILSASAVAERIKSAFPGALLSTQQIEEHVIGFASKMGVAMEGEELLEWHEVSFSDETGVRL